MSATFILKLLSKPLPSMQTNAKVDESDTISNSRRPIETPKSAPISFKREKLQKRISLMENLDETPRLWKESSSSLSRDRSPSHKIPNASRFRSEKEEENKSTHFVTLNLRGEIGKNPVKFPQSKRPEHFLNTSKMYNPSPATYNCSRFLQETHSAILPGELYLNPQGSSVSASKVKGVSIPSFNSYHKSYMDHSKHLPYQPETTEGNPGPGSYNHTWITKKKPKSYSIRVALKKFNQTTIASPGPGAYSPFPSEPFSSINMKGTNPISNRTYLTKFQKFPCPQSYRIARFLEQFG